MTRVLPAPTWFAIIDIALAYIPMAWIGGKLVAEVNRIKFESFYPINKNLP
jgi:hypothetical protein